MQVQNSPQLTPEAQVVVQEFFLPWVRPVLSQCKGIADHAVATSPTLISGPLKTLKTAHRGCAVAVRSAEQWKQPQSLHHGSHAKRHDTDLCIVLRISLELRLERASGLQHSISILLASRLAASIGRNPSRSHSVPVRMRQTQDTLFELQAVFLFSIGRSVLLGA